jgi:transposase
MLMFPSSVRIFVAMDPVDMRKSHSGLAAIVREQLSIDILAGHLVFFVNKRRTLAKLIFFDRTGLAILYKRLESGTFQLPTVEPGTDRAEIDPASLSMILEGIDLRSAVRRYSRSEDRRSGGRRS